jgi:hypothetical protein
MRAPCCSWSVCKMCWRKLVIPTVFVWYFNIRGRGRDWRTAGRSLVPRPFYTAFLKHLAISHSPSCDIRSREFKGDVILEHANKAQRYSRVIALSLTLALDGDQWSTWNPGRFSPGKGKRYPLYRRMCRPQGRFGRVWGISPTPGFGPGITQPVASRYTDYAIKRPRNCNQKQR